MVLAVIVNSEGQGIPTAVTDTLLSMADDTTSVVDEDGERVVSSAHKTSIPSIPPSTFDCRWVRSDSLWPFHLQLLPTPVMLRKGDACIAAYHLPHSASLNETGPIREQVIFRFGLPGTGVGTDLPEWEVASWRCEFTSTFF